MFNVVVAGINGPFKVIIEDCPRNGIEAIDFRRKSNLPPAPDNEIELPSLIFEDEFWVRRHVDNANNQADILLTQQRQQTFSLNAIGVMYKQTPRGVDTTWLPLIPSWAIAAYFNKPCPVTAQELLIAFWQGEARSLKKCKEEQAKLAEKTKADARLLLADEFKALNRKIEDLTREVQALNRKTDESEDDELDS